MTNNEQQHDTIQRRRVRDTGEQADLYQHVSLSGTYLLSALAVRKRLATFPRAIETWLEYGCGGGKSLWPAVPFLARGATATGVDVSRAMLRYAERAAELVHEERPDLGLRFARVDTAGPLPIPDHSLDVVHTSVVLQEIREREALEGVLREVARVLRPGGWFLGVLVNDRIRCEDYVSFTYAPFPDNAKRADGMRSCLSVETGIVWEQDRHWARDELAELLEEAGLGVHELADVEVPPETPPFAHAAWRGWKEELELPPLYLVQAVKP